MSALVRVSCVYVTVEVMRVVFVVFRDPLEVVPRRFDIQLIYCDLSRIFDVVREAGLALHQAKCYPRNGILGAASCIRKFGGCVQDSEQPSQGLLGVLSRSCPVFFCFWVAG